MTMLRTIGLVLLMCISAGSLEAGEANSGTERLWTFSGYTGGTVSGPDGDIQDVMRGSGFDARSPRNMFGPGQDHPSSKFNGASWMFKVTRYLKGRFGIGVLYGHTDLGLTLGYHPQAEYLHILSDVNVAAVMIVADDRWIFQSLRLEDVFQLTAGVGVAACRARSEKIGRDSEKSDDTKLGLAIDLGLSAPANRRFFVQGNLQFRQVGTMDVGPFTTTSSFSDDSAVFPKSEASFNHFFIGLGVGVRL